LTRYFAWTRIAPILEERLIEEIRMDKIIKRLGPIIYTMVVVMGIYFFYWFGALYHGGGGAAH